MKQIFIISTVADCLRALNKANASQHDLVVLGPEEYELYEY